MTCNNSWYYGYKKLFEYHEKNGNCDIKVEYVDEDGFNLGMWLAKQRYNLVDDDKIKLLDDLGVKWNIREETWDEKYYLLEAYYEKYGDINVPFDYVTKDGVKLGNWVYSQRQIYKNTTNNNSIKDHIMMLNDLNMDWLPRETWFLNQPINNRNDSSKYRKIMLNRMKLILRDLEYEIDGNISDKTKLKEIETEITKRMWH